MMKNRIYFAALLALLVFFSCTPSQNAVKGDNNKNAATSANVAGNEVLTDGSEENIPFDQYLRQVKGLRISGSGSTATVKIMGMGYNTARLNEEPLFVIDGVRIGNSLAQAANLVQTSNIKKVRVLKSASETSFYGSAGSNGVIEIITRRK